MESLDHEPRSPRSPRRRWGAPRRGRVHSLLPPLRGSPFRTRGTDTPRGAGSPSGWRDQGRGALRRSPRPGQRPSQSGLAFFSPRLAAPWARWWFGGWLCLTGVLSFWDSFPPLCAGRRGSQSYGPSGSTRVALLCKSPSDELVLVRLPGVPGNASVLISVRRANVGARLHLPAL